MNDSRKVFSFVHFISYSSANLTTKLEREKGIKMVDVTGGTCAQKHFSFSQDKYCSLKNQDVSGQFVPPQGLLFGGFAVFR